ncbi:MAG: selenite/tellurite reduction operon porin ExtI [Dissulfurimicrobium sp.]|uniref:selenite/tellurite reduction operon porin ExtI n=1 Tax=Dissulfurimicrobium sp. TaxID=2022436 RepID=UPI00404A9CC5
MLKKGILLSVFLFLSVFCLNKQASAGPAIDFGDNGGYLQVDIEFQGLLDHTNFGSGADNGKSRYDLYLRRSRLVFTGMLNDTWGAKFQTCGGTSVTRSFGGGGYELAKSNSKTNSMMRLIDGYLIGMLSDQFNLKIGLTKIPLTRANLDECFSPLSTDRSFFVYSPYGTDPSKMSRDMGIVAHGNFFENHMKYWVAVMEGREGSASYYNPFLDKTFRTSPEPKSNLEYVGRIHWSFLNPETGPAGSGYRGTYLGKKGKILTIGAAAAYEADAAYKNTKADPNNPLDAVVLNNDSVDYEAYTTDIFFEYPFDNGGVLTATALYLYADLDDAYKTAKAPADQATIVAGLVGQKEGWYTKLGYILPVTVGPKGKLQPFGRYEHWNMASIFGVNNQHIDQFGIGVNYFVLGDDSVRFSLEYQRTDYDKKTKLGDYLDMSKTHKLYDGYDLYTAMFMVVF